MLGAYTNELSEKNDSSTIQGICEAVDEFPVMDSMGYTLIHMRVLRLLHEHLQNLLRLAYHDINERDNLEGLPYSGLQAVAMLTLF